MGSVGGVGLKEGCWVGSGQGEGVFLYHLLLSHDLYNSNSRNLRLKRLPFISLSIYFLNSS